MKCLVVIFTLFTFAANAQTYTDSITIHRKHYKEDFIKEERSPLKGNDTSLLRFYDANKKYRVTADFTLTPDSPAFDMPTHSGRTKKFRQYGIAYFTIDRKKISLRVFQNLKLLEDEKYANHLFIPFTDATAYTETYAGGRYLDLETTDIKNGKLVIDFNKCYNPYCMYAEGYNCPIPPVENRLPVAVRAGEKLYAGEHKAH